MFLPSRTSVLVATGNVASRMKNKDVTQSNSGFVERISVENVQKNILVRRSWEADSVLHYDSTVQQVMLCMKPIV